MSKVAAESGERWSDTKHTSVPAELNCALVKQGLDEIVVCQDPPLPGGAVLAQKCTEVGQFESHEEASSAGRRKHRSQMTWDDASIFLCFLAAALVVAAPRALSMITIGSLVPYSPLPQALRDFKSMWAPCKNPERLFPAYSPDGQLFKWLVTADDVIIELGSTIALFCYLHAFFDPGDWLQSGRVRGLLQCAFYLLCTLQVVNIVEGMANTLALIFGTNTQSQLRTAHTSFSHDPWVSDLDDEPFRLISISYLGLWKTNNRQLLLFLCGMVLHVFFVKRNGDFHQAGCCHRIRLTYFILLAIVAACMHMLYVIFMWDSFLPLVCVKMCSVIVRSFMVTNLCSLDDASLDLANMALMSMESAVSMETRISMLSLMGFSTRSVSELLDAVLVSVGICCMDGLTYAWMFSVNVLRSSRLLKELNFMTLEGVLYAYQKHQQLMKICYSHFFYTQLTEITVCVLLSVYDIFAPVWSQQATWYSLADYYGVRRWNIVVIFLVRLGIQIMTGMGFLGICFRLLPASRKAMIKILFGRKRPIFFYFSFMLTYSCSWAPKCSTCESAQECLVYTECLKHGSVMLDGRDACLNGFIWSADALQTLLSTTNVSAHDLACERDDNWCKDVEELQKWDCPSTGGFWHVGDEPCRFERSWW